MPIVDVGRIVHGGLPAPIVFYTDHLSVQPVPVQATWADIVQIFSDPSCIEASPCTIGEGPHQCKGKACVYKSHSSVPPDDDGPNPMAWSPVEIVGKRLDKNVTCLTLLVLDFDGLTDDQCRHVISALAPYEHILHTTHSHRSDDGSACFRAIVLLSRPVLANQWHRFLASAIDFLGVTVTTTGRRGEQLQQPDRTCRDRARLYYRPSHPVDAPYDARHTPGKLLDVDMVLARTSAPVLISSASAPAPLPSGSPWNLDGDHVEEIILSAAENWPDNRRNEYCLAISGMLRRAGATREDARYIVYEIARQGGSSDPEKRATTADHTYDLPDGDDSAMTGFTRVSEIVGDAAARTIGDAITDASNEAFLRRVRGSGSGSGGGGSGSGGGGGGGGVGESTSRVEIAAASAPIDISLLRANVRALATRKMASDDRDDKIAAIILRRLLAGQALGVPGGVGDVETVREGASAGVDAEEAVRSVAGILAFSFPADTPWEGAAEVMRVSLSNMNDLGLYKRAERAYISSQIVRMRREDERRVQQIAQQERVALSPPQLSGHPPDGADWEDLIVKKPDGSIAQTLHNARVILRNHVEFRGTFRWNEVSKRIDVFGSLSTLSRFGLDNIVAAVQDLLSSKFSLNVPHRDLVRRVVTIARENAYDPLREYLLGLKWDGIPRLHNWLEKYCGAVNTSENARFLELVSRRWPVALVARGIDPGCKVDYALVIGGPGGIGKSVAFSILGGEWFCDSPVQVGDKDSRMLAGQYWICEMAELVAFHRSGHNQLKAFFSSCVDKFRPPYGATLEESPRRALFVGTANDDAYLGDETGNRKYLTVDCEYTESGLAALRRDRDQLLAEAVHMYLGAEACSDCTKHDRCKVHRWHFAYDEISITEAEADKRLLETPIKLAISEWWYGLALHERPACVTTLEAYKAAFESKGEKVPVSDLQQVGYALKKMGFARKRDTTGARHWRYYPSQELSEAAKVRRGSPIVVPGTRKESVLPS